MVFFSHSAVQFVLSLGLIQDRTDYPLLAVDICLEGGTVHVNEFLCLLPLSLPKPLLGRTRLVHVLCRFVEMLLLLFLFFTF